jgi:hypothetical protein
VNGNGVSTLLLCPHQYLRRDAERRDAERRDADLRNGAHTFSISCDFYGPNHEKCMRNISKQALLVSFQKNSSYTVRIAKITGDQNARRCEGLRRRDAGNDIE